MSENSLTLYNEAYQKWLQTNRMVISARQQLDELNDMRESCWHIMTELVKLLTPEEQEQVMKIQFGSSATKQQ